MVVATGAWFRTATGAALERAEKFLKAIHAKHPLWRFQRVSDLDECFYECVAVRYAAALHPQIRNEPGGIVGVGQGSTQLSLCMNDHDKDGMLAPFGLPKKRRYCSSFSVLSAIWRCCTKKSRDCRARRGALRGARRRPQRALRLRQAAPAARRRVPAARRALRGRRRALRRRGAPRHGGPAAAHHERGRRRRGDRRPAPHRRAVASQRLHQSAADMLHREHWLWSEAKDQVRF